MKAMFLCDKGDFVNAIPLLERILTNAEVPEVPILYAMALLNSKSKVNLNKAISILIDFLNDERPKDLKTEGIGLLINSYIELHDFENANKTLKEVLLKEPDNLLFKIQYARNLRLSGEFH